jgi:predicted enzyme related to lactoylglutathione lyase
MDRVVHFEIPADDVPRASAFYGSIFGWDLTDMSGQGMDYTLVMTTPVGEHQQPTEPGAINGGIMDRNPGIGAPVITIGVASIDDALKKVEANGGSVITPRTPIENMGAFAYFKDSEGNVMGLWEVLGG